MAAAVVMVVVAAATAAAWGGGWGLRRRLERGRVATRAVGAAAAAALATTPPTLRGCRLGGQPQPRAACCRRAPAGGAERAARSILVCVCWSLARALSFEERAGREVALCLCSARFKGRAREGVVWGGGEWQILSWPTEDCLEWRSVCV